jgi:hypothetical protein
MAAVIGILYIIAKYTKDRCFKIEYIIKIISNYSAGTFKKETKSGNSL